MNFPARIDFSQLPEFQALTEKQCRFVLAQAFTTRSLGQCAAFAGYQTVNPEHLRRVGLTVSRHPAVRAALAALAAVQPPSQGAPDGQPNLN